MGLTRRNFISLALAAGGASAGLWTLSDRYQQALAVPTSRKLALLIGINQYPLNFGLEGCVTDVELQRELLLHRFGFQASDVLTLTDWQATREAVETAFVEHLIQQAKPGDVVVFHFSGFGSTVQNHSTQPSLVLADAAPVGETPNVNDLLEETLWLLLRSLKTDKVTAVLDTSYVYPGNPLQGNLHIRSYPNPSTAQASPAELAFQDLLVNQLRHDRPQLTQPRSRPTSGLILAAAATTEVATEVRWNRFSAGLFTVALTQSLWQATPATTLYSSFSRASHQVRQLVNQQPQWWGQRRQAATLSPYFLPPTTAATGVVTAVGADTVQLWLGGLPVALLEQYGVNSVLTLLPPAAIAPTATAPIKLQIIARDGFTATAKICCAASDLQPSSSIQVGQFVQESVRILPRQLGLTIALDHYLERIERVDAISALTAVPYIASAIAGEQPADYLFSKLQSPQQLAALPTAPLSDSPNPSTVSASSYSLFSPGRQVVPNSSGETGEAVKIAVRRLLPKLQTLLAGKLLNLTVNDQTSGLSVRVSLEAVSPQVQVLAQQQTGGSRLALTQSAAPPTIAVPTVAVGDRVRYRVENISAQPVYPLAILLNSASDLLWLQFPVQADSSIQPAAAAIAEATAIAPSATAIIPAATNGAEWQVQAPSGFAVTYLILSRAPFAQTLITLTAQQRSGINSIVGTPITNPLEVTQAILQDLNQTSSLPDLGTPDVYALDLNAWASLQFTYQIG